MVRSIGRNAVLLGSLAVAATTGGFVARWLMSGRGGLGPGVLEAVSLPPALAAVAVTLVVSTALAVLTARVSNTAVGAFMLGGGLFGLAWRTGTLREIVELSALPGGGGGSLAGLAVETFIWSLLVLAATLVLFGLGGPLRDLEPLPGGPRPHPLWSASALKSAAAGVLALPVVWVVARSPEKGQAIGAVFCGGMAAGLAGRLLAPHVQPIMIFATPVFFGAVGHAIGALTTPAPLEEAFVTGHVGPLSTPMPIDWACGSLMGVAVGLGWARSFLHHEQEEPGA